MFTPAVKPVTAGKKMPNNKARDGAFSTGSRRGAAETSAGEPRKMLRRDRAMAPRMRYCVLMARAVLISVRMVSRSSVMVPQIRMVVTLASMPQ